jgi:translocon-associated protein subunit alpha
MKLFTKSLLIFALLSLAMFSPIIKAEEDNVEELEDEPIDDTLKEENVDSQTATETEADEEVLDEKPTGSPFAKTNVLFIKPEGADLQAGRLVKMLVGFHNNGSTEFYIHSMEASFRYPQDFSYHIQNFSSYEINKLIDPETESTFEYLFTPSETFASRQFGLTVNLRYRNQDGAEFVSAVYNETVSIVEPDEGLDGETFFLYIFLAAIVVLCGFGAYQFLSVFTKKGRSGTKSYTQSAQKVSNGNQSSDDVDFEWIPQSHLQPKTSPKTSPRLRKSKNGAALSSGNSSADDQ